MWHDIDSLEEQISSAINALPVPKITNEQMHVL